MSQMMTLEEKIALIDAADAAEEEGNLDLADRLLRQVPLAPNLARGLIESIGLDAVLAGGANLSEAEDYYGKDWLQQYRV